MMKTIVLNPFDIDSDAHSLSHALHCEDPSLTVQADAAQTDINFIVKQFGLTHELPYGMQTPVFADYSNIPNDYHAARMYIEAADEAFLEMPADVRASFDNDAGRFVAFVNDPKNYDDAIKLGLVPRLPDPAEPTDSQVPTAPNIPNPGPDTKASGGS